MINNEEVTLKSVVELLEMPVLKAVKYMGSHDYPKDKIRAYNRIKQLLLMEQIANKGSVL